MYGSIGGMVSGVADSISKSTIAGKQRDIDTAAFKKSLEKQYEALERTKDTYKETRADLKEFRKTGDWGLKKLKKSIKRGPGEYKDSEMYKSTLGEMFSGGDRAAGKHGFMRSGKESSSILEHDTRMEENLQKAIQRESRGMILKDHDKFLTNFYNSLVPYQNMAAMGQNAVVEGMGLGSRSAGQAQSSATMMGQTLLNYGNQQQAYRTRMANATQNLAQNISTGIGSIFSERGNSGSQVGSNAVYSGGSYQGQAGQQFKVQD